MKKIWCIPSEVETNKYMFQMQKAMRFAGYYVYGKGSKNKKVLCDIVHFNWFEDIPHNGNAVVTYIKKRIFIGAMVILNKRIVYTFHNKKPHDGSNELSVKLMHKLLEKADTIIIHSKISESIIKEQFPFVNQKKVCYVPLPNYKDVYTRTIEYPFKREDCAVFRAAIIGQVRPYKNVEVILEVANRFAKNSRIEFLICGKCINEQYENQLRSMVKSKNVILDLRFVDDGEIVSLMDNIDCVILPYNTDSALNSAAAILAFTFGKCVVSTNTGTIQDFHQMDGIVSYEYSSSERVHADRLYIAIGELYKQWNSNKDVFDKNGNILKTNVLRNNSLDIVSNCLKKVYL